MSDHEALSLSPFEALCRTAKALFGVADATVHRDGATPAGAARACLPLIERWQRGDVDLDAGCLVVEDAATEAWLAGHGSSGLVACAPIGAEDDRGAVALCLADPRPRRLTAEDRARLVELASLAAALVEAEARAVAARQQADFFRMIAEHSTDTLVRGTLDGVRLYISPGVRTLLGYEPEEMTGRRALEITHPDDAETFARVMADIRAGRIEHATTEHRQRHRDGRWVWMEAHIRLTRDGASGQPDGYVVSVRDVSHRKATEARLEHAALHDPLTGLANRTLFRDRLHLEIARCRRTGAHFALFWLDLDRFKEVNDRLGHEAGDTVLKTVAERLKAAVRDEDTVARIGGDEFVVLRAARESEGAPAAAALAARLAATLDEPVDCAGVPVRIGLSVGVSLTEVEGLEADRLLRAADRALYRAKDGGRGRAIIAR
ncbi:diguanylate cyclase [Pseudoxanthobacter sp. M-2]|uniref:diguanylate cyclase domain-containing protein n=1 Tax=Pseudoxanthobacter sp. M-2 TaxID=3078754 RepID=UPI0038FCCFE7